MSVVSIRRPAAEPPITKKELAAALGRSERWIEMRQRDDGLPIADTDRYGRRRYSLADVQAWLHDYSKPRTQADRIADLERKVVRLTAIVERLEGRR